MVNSETASVSRSATRLRVSTPVDFAAGTEQQAHQPARLWRVDRLEIGIARDQQQGGAGRRHRSSRHAGAVVPPVGPVAPAEVNARGIAGDDDAADRQNIHAAGPAAPREPAHAKTDAAQQLAQVADVHRPLVVAEVGDQGARRAEPVEGEQQRPEAAGERGSPQAPCAEDAIHGGDALGFAGENRGISGVDRSRGHVLSSVLMRGLRRA